MTVRFPTSAPSHRQVQLPYPVVLSYPSSVKFAPVYVSSCMQVVLPSAHAAHDVPSQYSSMLHDVHDAEVASPPGLNEPTGHVWQVDPSQYSFEAHHVLIGLPALTQRVAAWLFDTPQ